MGLRRRKLRRKCSAKRLQPDPRLSGAKRLRRGRHPNNARKDVFKSLVARRHHVSSGQPLRNAWLLRKSLLHKSHRNVKIGPARSRARKDVLHPRPRSSAVLRPPIVVSHPSSVVCHQLSAARQRRLSAGPLPKRVPSVAPQRARFGPAIASAKSTAGGMSIVRHNIMTTAAITRGRAISFSLAGPA
jgi:hypothetical protein